MKVNFNNVNFKGYKNTIVEKMSEDGYKVAYIATQLDNNGDADLDKWLAIQKEQGVKFPKETMTLIYKCNKNNADLDKWLAIQKEQGIPLPKDIMTIVNKHYDKEEALLLNEKNLYIGKDLNKIKSKSELNLAMKIYTFLAKITREMSQTQTYRKDGEFTKTVQHLFSTILNMSDLHTASEITAQGVENTNFKQVASFFNKGIARSMMQYFK